MSKQISSANAGSSLVEKATSQKVKITAEEWGAKARAKAECYHQVGLVFGAYLPPIEHITSWHLRDLSTGVKKMIKGADVKFLHVPMYDKLSVDEFLKYIDDYPFVKMCLPDRENEVKKLGRQYIINVIYTRLGEKFSNWVNERVDQRHQTVKEEGNKFIELDPELAEIFKASKAVSTSNGTAYHLFKATVIRRRTKREIEEAKLEEAAKKLEIETKMKRYAELEQRVASQQE